MKKLVYAVIVSLIGWQTCAIADDIDIYVQQKPSTVPLVSMILDIRPPTFSNLDNCTDYASASCEALFHPLDFDIEEGNDVYNDLLPPIMAQFYGVTPEEIIDSASPKYAVNNLHAFIAILEKVLSNEEFDDIYMSIKVSNFDDGGTILKGYTRLGEELTDSSGNAIQGRDALVDVFRQIPPIAANEAHQFAPMETYFEWFRYINGGLVINGTSTQGNFTDDHRDLDNFPTPDFDPSIISGANYIMPPIFSEFECTALYSVATVFNAGPGDGKPITDLIDVEMEDGAGDSFEDMLIYMNTHDLVPNGADGKQNLKTWVISDSGSLAQTERWADAGGTGMGVLLVDAPDKLEIKLTDSFAQIISESSTFVASSVPVNVFNRTESLPNLYIALFEAQATADWPGNLKKLKLADTDDNGVFDQVQDANGNPAFETDDDENIGRLDNDALTFWTLPDDLPPAILGKNEIEGKDGRSVTRGGAGQIIPGFISGGPGSSNSDNGARQLFVEPESGTTLQPFNAVSDAPTASEKYLINTLLDVDFDSLDSTGGNLSEQSVAIRKANYLLNWSRGRDVDDNDNDNSTREARSWIMGASIHSRPLAVNYGTRDGYTEENPNLLLMMGTNDGYFHIFRDSLTDGTESGEELFAFMPGELIDQVSELKRGRSTERMIYGVDGKPTSFVVDNDGDGNIESEDNDEAYVYFGLRRGGKSYYAFDVSDPDVTTTVPSLIWKISNADADFTELGLTFSAPVSTTIKYLEQTTDVLIFAGGYNGGWDSTFTNRVGKDLNDEDDTEGNAIYIVNARTGALIWKAVQSGAASNTLFPHSGMVDSIPSSVTPVDSNGNSITDRLYVGDTGGAVWRVDLPENRLRSEAVGFADHRRDNWFVTKFAELGTDGAATDRRFFHEPDVVLSFDINGSFDGVLIASGDRAHPLEESVTNYLVYMKDRKTVSGDISVKDREIDSNLDGIGDGVFQLSDILDVTDCILGTEAACVADSLNGWRIELLGEGEKGLSKPLVDDGVAIFSSYQPTDAESICDVDEGDGFAYLVKLTDGSAVGGERNYYLGPGIPSSAVAISGAILFPSGGVEIDLEGASGAQSKLHETTGKTHWLIYWRERGIDKL